MKDKIGIDASQYCVSLANKQLEHGELIMGSLNFAHIREAYIAGAESILKFLSKDGDPGGFTHEDIVIGTEYDGIV